MDMIRRVLALVGFSVFCGMKARAQVDIRPVLISEGRLTERSLPESDRHRTVITRLEFSTWGLQTLTDLLQHVQGVQANRRGPLNAQTDLKINGGTFEQTLVLLNGYPILDPQTGHHLMNLPVTLQDIERVEVLTGPQAHSYGINGLAGVINLVTRQPAGSGAELSAQGATYGDPYYGGTLHASGAVAAGRQRHYLSASADRGNGYRANTGVRNGRAFYQGEVKFRRGQELQFMAGGIDNDFGASGFYAYPYDSNSTERVQTLMGGLRYRAPLNATWTLKGQWSARFNTDEYIFIKQNPSFFRNTHRSFSSLGGVHAVGRFKSTELAVGMSWLHQQIQSSNLDTFQRDQLGIHLEQRWSPHPRWSASWGAFVNYHRQWGWQVLPGFQLGWQASPSLRLFANWGTANRLPSYTDLYYKGPSNIGNAALRPEKAMGFDLGGRYTSGPVMFGFNVFSRQVRDLIDWTKPELANVWQPSNFGLQRVYGFQSSAEWCSKRQQPWRPRHLRLQYQFNHSDLFNRLPGTVSRYTLDYFRHQALASFTFNLAQGFYVTPSLRYLNRMGFTAYLIADARLGYTRRRYQVFLDLGNAFKSQFLEANAQPMPGRMLQAGASVRLF